MPLVRRSRWARFCWIHVPWSKPPRYVRQHAPTGIGSASRGHGRRGERARKLRPSGGQCGRASWTLLPRQLPLQVERRPPSWAREAAARASRRQQARPGPAAQGVLQRYDAAEDRARRGGRPAPHQEHGNAQITVEPATAGRCGGLPGWTTSTSATDSFRAPHPRLTSSIRSRERMRSSVSPPVSPKTRARCIRVSRTGTCMLSWPYHPPLLNPSTVGPLQPARHPRPTRPELSTGPRQAARGPPPR